MKGDYDKAIADYTEVIRLDPKDAKAYYGRGEAYGRKATTTRPSPTTPRQSGSTQNPPRHIMNAVKPTAEKSEYDKAIADYTEVIRLKPAVGVPEAYRDRGFAYRKKGDFDKTIADCTVAIRLKPDLAEAYYCRGKRSHPGTQFSMN